MRSSFIFRNISTAHPIHLTFASQPIKLLLFSIYFLYYLFIWIDCIDLEWWVDSLCLLTFQISIPRISEEYSEIIPEIILKKKNIFIQNSGMSYLNYFEFIGIYIYYIKINLEMFISWVYFMLQMDFFLIKTNESNWWGERQQLHDTTPKRMNKDHHGTGWNQLKEGIERM